MTAVRKAALTCSSPAEGPTPRTFLARSRSTYRLLGLGGCIDIIDVDGDRKPARKGSNQRPDLFSHLGQGSGPSRNHVHLDLILPDSDPADPATREICSNLHGPARVQTRNRPALQGAFGDGLSVYTGVGHETRGCSSDFSSPVQMSST